MNKTTPTDEEINQAIRDVTGINSSAFTESLDMIAKAEATMSAVERCVYGDTINDVTNALECDYYDG